MTNSDMYTNQRHLREILGTRETPSLSLNEVLICFKLLIRFFVNAFSRKKKRATMPIY